MHPASGVLYATGSGRRGKDLYTVSPQNEWLTRVGGTSFAVSTRSRSARPTPRCGVGQKAPE